MSKTKKNVNTTKTVTKGKAATAAELDKQIKNSAKILKEEAKKEVLIPKYLKGRLGANVPIGVNGAVIHVPVGEKVKIPASMADVLNESLAKLTL